MKHNSENGTTEYIYFHLKLESHGRFGVCVRLALKTFQFLGHDERRRSGLGIHLASRGQRMHISKLVD